MARFRDTGLVVGDRSPGPLHAITDVPGVRVGHVTLIAGDGPLVVGKGSVRTGVTVILPHGGDVWCEPLAAGTMVGRDGVRAYALPQDRFLEEMRRS